MKRPTLPTYFFLNGNVHRKLHVNRGKDLLTAWNYPEGRRVQYNFTDALYTYQKAFYTQEVAKMLNRDRLALELAILNGKIDMPQYTYGIDENRNKHAYMWREEDILKTLDYFASVGRGRPRKDGLVTEWNLPSPRELRAMIHGEEVFYVKQGDDFVPTFRARNWN